MSNASEDKLKEVISFYNRRGFNKTTTKFQISQETLSRYLRKAKALDIEVKEHEDPRKQHNSKLIKRGNTMFIDSPVSHDIEELMENFGIDKDYWDITKTVINEWGSADNFNRQCKAWLQAKGDIIDWEVFKRKLIKDLKKYSPRVPEKHTGITGDVMQEICIFDLHLGKLGWKPETGENYDNKIAKKRFHKAIDTLITYGKLFKVEQFLFPVGNDFFNSDFDYPYPQTTKGTPQENDLRWQKSFQIGRQMLCEAIDTLSEIAPVYVPIMPGNHDFQKSFYLGEVLEIKYESNDNVIIDNSPSPRKYHHYHNNLIGFSHGRSSDVPEARLIQLMPQEQPRLWSESMFREWHLGDIHHKKKIQLKSEHDHQGIVLRYMRTLMSADSWENQKGYKGAVKGAETYIWDKKNGMIANFNHNLSGR